MFSPSPPGTQLAERKQQLIDLTAQCNRQQAEKDAETAARHQGLADLDAACERVRTELEMLRTGKGEKREDIQKTITQVSNSHAYTP